MACFQVEVADLAPGDRRAAEFDLAQLELTRIRSAEDPLFEVAYAQLWEQFGAAHELESRAVLARRLAWNPAESRDGYALRYDLLLLRERSGQFAAVRDHTAIADAAGAVVHLSHVLVAPAWRRTGLAGWLRALPIATARECLAAAGLPADAPITLVAEMEYPDDTDPAREIRLTAYERAGYRKIEPRTIDYHQPDFRPPELIGASGGAQPLPFQLIVRRVGHEEETTISGAEVRRIVERLYHIYAREFRLQDMAGVWRRLRNLPPPEARLALLAPTERQRDR